MLIQLLEEEDPFSCLLSIQCSIEVFAAQAATPIEKAIAQSMRAMSEEMMRRTQTRVTRRATPRAASSKKPSARVRFQRARKS